MATTDLLRSLRIRLATAACLACLSVGAAASPPGDDATGQTFLAKPLLVSRITSGFAMRTHPIKKKRRHHEGVDFAAPLGTPVRSVDGGRVVFAGKQNGYGNVVYIEHDGGDRTTLYAHLDRIHVGKGEHVLQGDEIGTVGQTGLASGPHLHFEVHEAGQPIDPMRLAYSDIVERREPVATLAMPAVACVDLLQKASLEALDAAEIESLRQGCTR